MSTNAPQNAPFQALAANQPTAQNSDSGPARDEIQTFYDRQPYPPPVTDLDQYRQFGQNRARLRPHDGQPIHFDDERWLEYVPIRRSGTICIEERLPPGAAGVLINRPTPIPISICRLRRPRNACLMRLTANAPSLRFYTEQRHARAGIRKGSSDDIST